MNSITRITRLPNSKTDDNAPLLNSALPITGDHHPVQSDRPGFLRQSLMS